MYSRASSVTADNQRALDGWITVVWDGQGSLLSSRIDVNPILCVAVGDRVFYRGRKGC